VRLVVECAMASIVVARFQTGKVRLLCEAGSVRIWIVPQHQQALLDELLALAQGYAEFAMRNLGHVPPALLADSPHRPNPLRPEQPQRRARQGHVRQHRPADLHRLRSHRCGPKLFKIPRSCTIHRGER
jgi:hypothetical protein